MRTRRGARFERGAGQFRYGGLLKFLIRALPESGDKGKTFG
jgi:hypothetical protein